MERTGIVRVISGYKLVIPPEVRVALGWKNGDKIEYIIDNGRLILQEYKKVCIFCKKDTEDVFFGMPLCINCRLEIVKTTKFLQKK